jgi:hypothetical protein
MPEILPNYGLFDFDLDSLNALSLPALWAFGHDELHGLSFLQPVKAPCNKSVK